jgi:hypothetical protein
LQLLLKGTAIVTIATGEFVVMVADKLGYINTPRGIRPAADPIQKVFSWGNRILIGSAGTMRLWGRHDIGIDSDSFSPKFRSVKIEYEFEKWISDFCAGQRADTGITPLEFAERVFDAARKTLQPVETIAESGNWRGDNPGDPIVIYVIAGFSEDFSEFGVYQSEIQLNAENNGLAYVPPTHHLAKIHLAGETEYIAKVLAEKEPWRGLFKAFCRRHADDIEEIFPSAQPKVKEAITEAVSLVRVQHEFANETVGSSVTVIFTERTSGLVTLGSL